jgi:hypothetical protein
MEAPGDEKDGNDAETGDGCGELLLKPKFGRVL